jgi:hypothetical protein
MKAEDLIELADDPRFISGIYNYCDNWCERCAFASRCLSYAQQQADFDEDDPESRDLGLPEVLEKLKETFQTAKELALMGAAKWGKAGNIQPLIAHLEELRNWAEREYPGARSFIRPGFDEITEHVM